MPLPQILFLVGPTAVGKSEAIFQLARKYNGEIVSCDAMQVYKEINIASNKPSEDMLQKIPHHLVNTVSIKDEFDVSKFNKHAAAAIQNILSFKKFPIVSGGSGLYMQVLLDGIFEEGVKDQALRDKLEQQAKDKGNKFLHDQLKKIDPSAAQRIHVHDLRRIVRALEVYSIKKKNISQVQKQRQGLWGHYDIKIIALNRERNELYQRIDNRVDQMFDQGLVEEIERLKDKKWSTTAGRVIGVPEVLGFLQGEYDLDRAKYLMKLNTRHYAKRQLTWFRKEKRLQWITIEGDDTLGNVVSKIEAVL